MPNYQKVKSSMQISVEIADYLQLLSPRVIDGRARGKTIRDANNAIQGRGKRSAVDLITDLREKSDGYHDDVIPRFERDIAALHEQMRLLYVPYTTRKLAEYDCETVDGEAGRPLKFIQQDLFDRAVKEGFPMDFFKDALFDGITIYCMPDDADCIGSTFRNCDFAVCRMKGAMFEGCTIRESGFHSCLLADAVFLRTSISHTFFQDCTFDNARFLHSKLKSFFVTDSVMDNASFRHSVLDRTTFSHIMVRNVHGLDTSTILCDGASEEDARKNRQAIFKALKTPDPDAPHRAGPGR